MHEAVSISPTRLRENIYTVLDDVLTSGRAVPIKRKGQTVWLVSARQVPELERSAPARGAQEDERLKLRVMRRKRARSAEVDAAPGETEERAVEESSEESDT